MANNNPFQQMYGDFMQRPTKDHFEYEMMKRQAMIEREMAERTAGMKAAPAPKPEAHLNRKLLLTKG